MSALTNARLCMLAQVYENTLALLTDDTPRRITDLSADLDPEDVEIYDLDLDAAAAFVDSLDWHIFAPFLLGIPPLYHTVPDDYWSKLVASIGPDHSVEDHPLLRFMTWCGETWAWNSD